MTLFNFFLRKINDKIIPDTEKFSEKRSGIFFEKGIKK